MDFLVYFFETRTRYLFLTHNPNFLMTLLHIAFIFHKSFIISLQEVTFNRIPILLSLLVAAIFFLTLKRLSTARCLYRLTSLPGLLRR